MSSVISPGSSLGGFDLESADLGFNARGGFDIFGSPNGVNTISIGEDGSPDLGDDFIFGGSAGDAFLSGAGNDVLIGGAGDDFLDGGAGDDVIIGGAGDDVIIGGDGADNLRGGDGADVFVISGIDGELPSGVDVISDFSDSEDLLVLQDVGGVAEYDAHTGDVTVDGHLIANIGEGLDITVVDQGNGNFTLL